MASKVNKAELDDLFRKAEVKRMGATLIESYDDEKESLTSLSYDMFFKDMGSQIDIDQMLINMKYIMTEGAKKYEESGNSANNMKKQAGFIYSFIKRLKYDNRIQIKGELDSLSEDSINGSGIYKPNCKDMEKTYRKFCSSNEEIEENNLFDLYEQNTDKILASNWRDELRGKCFK